MAGLAYGYLWNLFQLNIIFYIDQLEYAKQSPTCKNRSESEVFNWKAFTLHKSKISDSISIEYVPMQHDNTKRRISVNDMEFLPEAQNFG